MSDREEPHLPVESRRSRLLKVVCGLLILYVASTMLISFASIPRYYQRVTTGTVPVLTVGTETRISSQLVAQWAAERGMSLPVYALYTIALNGIITLGFASVAVLILWKARRSWFHWFTALVLLFFPTGGLWDFTLVARVAYPYVAAGALLWPAFALFLFLFPNGRAVPRWAGWILGGLAVLHMILQIAMLEAQLRGISDTQILQYYQLFNIVLAGFPLILISQIYRYVRVSNPTERAQTRWFVVGLALQLGIDQLIDMLTGGGASATAPDTGLPGDITDLAMLIIPASIGISILRYRLYDIDVIIRRTLVYSLLTAALAGLYFGSVVLFQLLLSGLTQTTEPPAFVIVLSTLAIAVLFHPLRRRIQNFIDQRFYRHRYDTEQTLLALAGVMRDEVDLEQLNSHLLSVVDQTLEPDHTSLWLRGPGFRAEEP